MYDDDIQESEKICPKCSKHMFWRRCIEIGCDDGIIEDDDPFWQMEVEECEFCKGTGIQEWCRNCGYGI